MNLYDNREKLSHLYRVGMTVVSVNPAARGITNKLGILEEIMPDTINGRKNTWPYKVRYNNGMSCPHEASEIVPLSWYLAAKCL